jgi:hypothetical protein
MALELQGRMGSRVYAFNQKIQKTVFSLFLSQSLSLSLSLSLCVCVCVCVVSCHGMQVEARDTLTESALSFHCGFYY